MANASRFFDASSARCTVLTFKEGLLSRAAHDLRIRVLRFSIEADIDRSIVQARFDPRSLRVDCAMRDGVEARGALSSRDTAEIDRIIQEQVLHSSRFPEIVFTSSSAAPSAEGWTVLGRLSLHGILKPVTAQISRKDDLLSTEVRLHQPDYGIEPFTALLGTLRIKPEVVVRIETTRSP